MQLQMNKELLIENLEKKNNIILYFNSGGCGPCMQAKPLVQKIAESKKGYVYSDVVEGSEGSSILENFCGVEFYPTLIIIENSKIKRYVGINEIKTL
jgi:thiol-disulfide isomerase/thioredoxin